MKVFWRKIGVRTTKDQAGEPAKVFGKMEGIHAVLGSAEEVAQSENHIDVIEPSAWALLAVARSALNRNQLAVRYHIFFKR